MRFLTSLLLVLTAGFSTTAWTSTASLCARLLGGVSLSRPLPVIKQDVNGKCGPSSAAIAAAYFGKLTPQNPFDPFELSNLMTSIVYTNAQMMQGPIPPAATCWVLNAQNSLADAIRTLGIWAMPATASLDEIALMVASEEVVLVHWWMGPDPMDYHWSAVQAIAPSFVALRDPWPTSPNENVQPLPEFLYRASSGIPGRFSVVRTKLH